MCPRSDPALCGKLYTGRNLFCPLFVVLRTVAGTIEFDHAVRQFRRKFPEGLAGEKKCDSRIWWFARLKCLSSTAFEEISVKGSWFVVLSSFY